MSRALVVACLLVLVGCATKPQFWFRNEQEFDAFIADLDLENLSPADAAARLRWMGFTCSPSAIPPLRCVQTSGTFVCEDTYEVLLEAHPSPEFRCKVTSDFRIRCL